MFSTTIMDHIKSALLIDNNDVDNFINHRLLKSHGVTNVISFNDAHSALLYLQETNVIYHLILVDIYMPIVDGFEFVDKFYELGLHNTQGEIYVLTSHTNSSNNEKSANRNIKCISKPLTIEKLRNKG
jgi:two-component SAPR family response regulator